MTERSHIKQNVLADSHYFYILIHYMKIWSLKCGPALTEATGDTTHFSVLLLSWESSSSSPIGLNEDFHLSTEDEAAI